MSGLEVLGAAAAASQFAVYGVSIINFISKIQDAPESIQKQSVQIKQLLDISKLVKNSASLQTVEARSCKGVTV